MSKFAETLNELAAMAKVSIVDIKEPTEHLCGLARTESETEAQTFAGLLDRSGINAIAVSRNNRHVVFIG